MPVINQMLLKIHVHVQTVRTFIKVISISNDYNRNNFPKRPSGAPLHNLSKLYDIPFSFVFPKYKQVSVLVYLLSPKVGCCWT